VTLEIKEYSDIGINPLELFTYALKSPESQRQYPRRFKVFLDFLDLGITDIENQSRTFLQKGKENPIWAEEMLMRFCNQQKQRVQKGEISESTIPNYFKATKLFCDMNNLTLNWKKISKGVPTGRKAANDRAPLKEEIVKLINYPDRRIKAIVYTMVSSGIRIGAWDYLRWKHIVPIIENDNIIAAKIIVYAGDSEEYYSFITAEAYTSLKEWMDFRKSHGESISGESWLMRDIWQTTNLKYGANFGLATVPQKLDSKGINKLLYRALWSQGLRTKLEKGQKRHEFKAAHGFRKFFKTHTEQVMRPINVEMLMGHSTGVSDSYYKPTEKEILKDYLNSVDLLTINQDNNILSKEIKNLQIRNQNNEYIIKGKLQEKYEEINLLKESDSMNKDAITHLSDQVSLFINEIQILKGKNV
jgi:hypothetical protein